MRRLLQLLTLLILATSPAIAFEPIGQIVALEGKAEIARQDTSEAKHAKEGDKIQTGDLLTTEENSKLLLLLNDGTELVLGEQASLSADDYIFNADEPETGKGHFNILRGAFLFTSGLLSKNETPDMKITTGYATIGIRGTTVWGGPLKDQYGVLLQLGEVDVTNKEGTTVTLYPGQGAFIKNETSNMRKVNNWDNNLVNQAIRMVTFEDKDSIETKLKAAKENTAP